MIWIIFSKFSLLLKNSVNRKLVDLELLIYSEIMLFKLYWIRKFLDCSTQERWFMIDVVWCFRPLSTIYQLYRGGQFYW
jgi:hypothetical protein